jgi:retron-type reverse transcriptase
VVVKNLKTTSAPGPDNIHNLFLKQMSPELKIEILRLFNLSLTLSKIPKSWSLSHVTMIPKKSDKKSDPNNYRPISLTSCLGKLCERLILLRIEKFLRKKKIIIKQQSGFRARRQTTDNLVFLTQKIKEGFNKSQKTCVLFFDIAKAFDKVWHNGLLYKIIQIGTPFYLVKWLIGFLKHRQFQVKVNTSFSKLYSIETGVPQGAILSPTLFSIFINDVPITTHYRNHSCLFADDLCSLFFSKSTNEIKVQLQKYLNNIELWLRK